MKKVYLLLLFWFCLYGANAQGPKFQWARQVVGGPQSYNEGTAVASDTNGNVYYTGYFEDTADFDPGSGVYNLMSTGSLDMFVSKLDKAGKLVWVQHFGGIEDDGFLGMTIDLAGNVYLTGTFGDTVDFDPDTATTFHLIAEGSYDAFVLKLNSSGALVWAKQFGGVYDEIGFGIALDNSGNIYTTGYFEDEVDFDPGSNVSTLLAEGYDDVYVSKLDGSGNFVWAKQFAGKSNFNSNIGYAIAIDGSGNVLITGTFQDTVDFNPGAGTLNLISYGEDDIFIVKLNSSGSLVWAKQVGGQSSDMSRSIALDGLNNVYTTGSFADQVDFNPGSSTFNVTSNGGNDMFLLKLDANGNYVWFRRVGSADEEEGYFVLTDASNNVYTSSTFYGTVDYDPGGATHNITSFGYQDAAILKLNSSGAYQWVEQFGGTNAYLLGARLAWNKTGAFYATGAFSESVDFDPGADSTILSATDKLDIYVLRLQECVTTSQTITASACKSYTLNNQTYTASGTYTQKITNSLGCDSNITLKLTIKNTTNTITTSACKDYTLNGQTYTTSGTYTQTLTNAAGCDSLLILKLTIKNTADTLTVAACNSYTLNSQIYTSSGTYTQTLPNAAGCDSTITLYLTISSQNTSSTLNKTACGSFTLNGQTYTSSGTYMQTIQNVGGCDSVITLNLVVKKSSKFTITNTSCKRYTLNGQTYTSSGNYIQILVNSVGCDSVITLVLTINNAVNTVVQAGAKLTADATGAQYQWLDCGNAKSPISGATQQSFTATQNGSYAVEVKQNSCTDTSDCYVVSGLGVDNNMPPSGFKVYPNPTRGDVTILLSDEIRQGKLCLMGVTGKKIMVQNHLQGSNFKLDISALSKGVYILEISGNGVTYRTQVVRD